MAPWRCTLMAQKRLEKARYSVRRLRESFANSAAVTPSRCSCHRNEPIKPSPAPVMSTAATFGLRARALAVRV